jgi:2-oxoglutarate dehydrogenase E1 component
VIESFAQRAKSNAFTVKASSTDLAVARKQVHVQSLIAAYRFLGSRWADLDPLKRTERPKIPELEPAFYDLTESDMDIPFSAANTYFSRAEHMTLREIMQALRETYCGTIGAEFMHCTDPTEKRWWQERLESARSKPSFTPRSEAHPRPPDRGRRPGALPAHQVRRPEALLAGRRRELHRLDGRADPAPPRRACRKS